MSLSPRTKTRLRRLAAKYETAAFVDGDPIHFLRTALEITARLAEAFPGDPCRGDFALYGLGIDEEP